LIKGVCVIKHPRHISHIANIPTTNVLISLGGNDTLTGGTTDDILVGGAGNDTLTGAGGNLL
jgi:Ca2+-binding RTX toxin-like protein